MNIISNLSGGLGNQMFEYSFARSLSIDLGSNLYINDTNLSGHAVNREYTLNIFENIKKDILVDNGRTLSLTNFESEFEDNYYENILNSIKNEIGKFDTLIINGYFQSKKLFENHLDIIKKDFDLPKRNLKDNSISLQVRRGDYVGNTFHEVCTIEYYNASIRMIQSKVNNPIFYIISEDPDWVINNLEFNESKFEIPIRKENKSERDDFETMISCDYHIISNSSFGWWPAILSDSKLVISPDRWYANGMKNEMIQPNWITIET